VDSDSGRSTNTDLKGATVRSVGKTAVVNGLNRPLFHIDLTSALQSAIANAKARDEVEDRGGAGIGEIP